MIQYKGNNAFFFALLAWLSPSLRSTPSCIRRRHHHCRRAHISHIFAACVSLFLPLLTAYIFLSLLLSIIGTRHTKFILFNVTIFSILHFGNNFYPSTHFLIQVLSFISIRYHPIRASDCVCVFTPDHILLLLLFLLIFFFHSFTVCAHLFSHPLIHYLCK